MPEISPRYHRVATTSDMDNGTPIHAGPRVVRRPVPPPMSPDSDQSNIPPTFPQGAGVSSYPTAPSNPHYHAPPPTDISHTDSLKVHVPPSDSDGSDASKLVVQPTEHDKIYVPYEYGQLEHHGYYAKATTTAADGIEHVPSIRREYVLGDNGDLPPPGVKNNKRKRMWWIIGAVLLVLIIVGAVVGGVLGSRKKGNSNSESSESKDIDVGLSPASASPSASSSASLRSTTTSKPSTTPTSQLCPVVMSLCSDTVCVGKNGANGEEGKCTEGIYKDCACRNVCDVAESSGSCSYQDCDGLNDPDGGLGVCSSGKWWGCYCKSICGTVSGSCFTNGCEGRNGRCTVGKYRGCYCLDGATKLVTSRTSTSSSIASTATSTGTI